MLYIVNERTQQEKTWHLGEPVPAISGVQFIQADGDELAYLTEMFPALVARGNRVAIILEPFAEMVYRNLLVVRPRYNGADVRSGERMV